MIQTKQLLPRCVQKTQNKDRGALSCSRAGLELGDALEGNTEDSKIKKPIMFFVFLHITNVLGTLAITDYSVNKSLNLSLHFIKHNQFPSTELGNTVLKNVKG